MFEMMVRRFSEPISALRPEGTLGLNRIPSRTDFTDGRECRKCRTFYPA